MNFMPPRICRPSNLKLPAASSRHWSGKGVDAPVQGNARLRLQSRHQLFPQVLRLVHAYIRKKVNFYQADPRELGLEVYVRHIVERLLAAIEPDDDGGELPLLPLLNRYTPISSTADVEFMTHRPTHGTERSHINQVVLDTVRWEAIAAFHLEAARDIVLYYARNDRMGLVIPYEYEGVPHGYEPDYLVKLVNGVTLVLEIKGYEDDQTMAKHTAARRWVTAVNNWGKLGTWDLLVCREPRLLQRELGEKI